jgi:hypothetical protein
VEWKKALEIDNLDWLGIGRHIAKITREKLEEQAKEVYELTNHLIFQGNRYLESSYVDDYISGEVSFGCFFPQYREFLDIKATDVFKNTDKDKAEEYLQDMDEYLTDSSNLESLVIFLKYKPGKELREYVKNTLSKKRQEAIDTPYHQRELGLDPEEDTNPYMEYRRELFKFIKEFVSSYQSFKKPLKLLPCPDEDSKSIVLSEDSLKKLYEGIYGRLEKSYKEYHDAPSLVPNSRIIIQPAIKRDRFGVTIDFLYPDGDYFDKLISETREGEPFLEDYFMGLDAWREAYTNGTFSSLKGTDKSIQPLSNICFALDIGVEGLVPTREPKESERYEMHQRWVISTGGYYHGTYLGSQEEIEKKQQRPDPVSRNGFEEDAYRINSGLAISFGLYDKLPELVAERVLLKA